MIGKPRHIVVLIASLLLVVLGISKLGLDRGDLGAVGREELDSIPPPSPPVDLILDKPTIIGFLRDSLYLDSVKEHLGEGDFYASMDDNNREQWWYDDCAECLKLSDTLELDMNGNGISEFIFWDLGDCTSLVIREAGADDIRIGCNIQWQNDLPKSVDWVNVWYRVTEQEVFETTFDDNEVLGERKVKLDNYGFYIGKEEAGGGVIGYVDGQLVYLHQGC